MFLYQRCWHPFGQSMGTRFIHTSWLKLTLMCALVWSTSINWLPRNTKTALWHDVDEDNTGATVTTDFVMITVNFVDVSLRNKPPLSGPKVTPTAATAAGPATAWQKDYVLGERF